MAKPLGSGDGAQTVTDVVESSFPVLRLRLTNTANNIGAAKPHPESRGTFERIKKKFQDMFYKAEADVNLEPEVSAEATERNKNRIRANFKAMKDQLDELEQETITSLDTLTPQQQEDVVTFWDGAGGFFKDVLNP